MVGERPATRPAGRGDRRRSRDHLGRTDPPAEAERRALLALGTMLGDPLRPLPPDEESTARQRRAFEELVEQHQEGQLARIADLGRRHGGGPALRRARRKVEAGDLLSPSALAMLDLEAAADGRSREEQERLASDHAVWREGAARRLAKDQGLLARLGARPEDFLGEVDRRSLRLCRRCGETAYPDPGRAGGRGRPDVASRCHFCGGTALVELDDPEVGR
ncbi:MAG: hypothetical protein ACR2KG_01035 [Nocardioidaceae bacterium]